MALAAFAVDNGVFWMARGQAQNAADAGALAGASALVHAGQHVADTRGWRGGDRGQGRRQLNLVNGASGGGPGDVGVPAVAVAPYNTNCVQVDVYRGRHVLERDDADLLRATSLASAAWAIKATATAQVSQADASGCMRPWFIDRQGRRTPIASPDCSYAAVPGLTGTATSGQHGDISHNDLARPATASWTSALAAAAIHDAIDTAWPDMRRSPSATRSRQSPARSSRSGRQGIDDLSTGIRTAGGVHVEYQPAGCNVTMNCTSANVVGGCAAAGTCSCPHGGCPYGGSQSPRLVQAALCDPS